MNRALLIGFLGLGLAACGDDGGGETGADPTTTGTVEPTTEPTMTSSPMTMTTTTETGTTTVEPGTTIGPDESSSGSDTEAGSSSSGAADGSSSTGDVEFTVTSPAFAEGELFPFNMHICEGNVHPQLDWVGAPEGTMSFGIFVTDLTIDFEHSAIWNIPADATGVPAGIEAVAMPPSVAGALQCEHWNGGIGYGGPGSCSNTYEFTVYALDVANLDAEVTADSTRFEVQTALEAHMIETTALSGVTRGSVCIQACTPMPE